MKKLYLGGDLLKKGSRLLRIQEAEQLESIGHYDVYNPMANKSINDKAVLPVAGLAEKIVKADTERLLESDIVVIEPQNDAIGTCVEVGQLLGYKQLADEILKLYANCPDSSPADQLLCEVVTLCQKQTNRKVYPHYEDIRLEGDTGNGYRSTVGINAYVSGACIDLANDPVNAPDGFYSWNQIINELSQQTKGKAA